MHRELRKTFIYVTHDQEEAMAMSDRIAVMKDAKILQVDTPRALYYEPTSSGSGTICRWPRTSSRSSSAQ